MELRIERHSARRLFFVLAAAAAVYVFATHVPSSLRFAGERLTEVGLVIIVAVTFTYMIRPGVEALARLDRDLHRGRVWGTLVMFVGLVLVGWIAGRLSVRPVAEEWKRMRPLMERSNRAEIQKKVKAEADRWLQFYRESLPDTVRESIDNSLIAGTENLLESFTHITERFAQWLRIIAELVVVPVLAFYFLTDGKRLRKEVELLVPDRYEESFGRLASRFDRIFESYVRGQLILCVIAGFVTLNAAWFMGLPYAFTLAVWGGIARAIPFFGPIIGGIPFVIVAWFSSGSTIATVAVAITLVLHFVESKFVMPKLIGHLVELHPVTIIVVVLIAFQFFGIVGMFLAAPVVAVVKAVLMDLKRPNQNGSPEIGAEAAPAPEAVPA